MTVEHWAKSEKVWPDVLVAIPKSWNHHHLALDGQINEVGWLQGGLYVYTGVHIQSGVNRIFPSWSHHVVSIFMFLKGFTWQYQNFSTSCNSTVYLLAPVWPKLERPQVIYGPCVKFTKWPADPIQREESVPQKICISANQNAIVSAEGKL